MLLFDQTKALEKPLGAEAAEVIAKIFEGQHEELATKGDLEKHRLALASDLEKHRLALSSDVEKLRLDLAAKLSETKVEIIKWLVGLSLAQISILVAILKLFK